MAPKSLSRRSRIAVGLAGQALANGITLPYYRFYRQNTLIPIQAIAKSVENGESTEMIVDRLNRWRDRKLHEFQFVQVAAALLAAAVIGCFSWTPQAESQPHWFGPAAWYSSLMLSITAVLLSSSEAFIFSAIKNAPPVPSSPISIATNSTSRARRRGTLPDRLIQELSMIIHFERPYEQSTAAITTRTSRVSSRVPTGIPNDTTERHRPSEQYQLDLDLEEETHDSHHREIGPEPIRVTIRWNMVFTWQAPMMLVAYSVAAFFIGLVIYVSAPLYDGHEGGYLNGPGKGAVFFLVWSAVSGGVFVWCSFWAYRFVELDGF